MAGRLCDDRHNAPDHRAITQGGVVAVRASDRGDPECSSPGNPWFSRFAGRESHGYRASRWFLTSLCELLTIARMCVMPDAETYVGFLLLGTGATGGRGDARVGGSDVAIIDERGEIR